MAKTIENLFGVLHWASDVILILLYFLLIRKIKGEKAILAIIIYSFCDLIFNLVTLSFSSKYIYIYLGVLFTFVEYGLFSYFLYTNIKSERFKRNILKASAAFVIFTLVYDILTKFKFIDSIPIGIETILIIVYAFYYLYEQMNDVNNPFIYSLYQFWVVIGLMVYLAGSFFIFLFASQLGRHLLNQFWFLTNAFYTLMNILFAVAIIIRSKKPRNQYAGGLRPYLN